MRWGYACNNVTLKDVRTNRSMIKRTYELRGLKYASELALSNVKDLVEIIKWNSDNGVDMYRMSSDIFPWMSEYDLTDLPDFEEISAHLKKAGEMASENNQRLSFHPGPFNILSSNRSEVVDKTLKELNQHGEIMDLMGLERSRYNKINVHLRTKYAATAATKKRFIRNMSRLHESVLSRLTVENDDKPAGFNTGELLDLGVPLVFDYLHHECNPGEMNELDALQAAVSTWPTGVAPVVHFSSSRKKWEDVEASAHFHADYIYETIDTHGMDVDVMIEAKAKNEALFEYLKTKVYE